MIGCKGKCRFEKPLSKHTYSLGFRGCTICEKSMKNIRCYCCGHVTRKGAQNNDSRSKRIAMVARI